MARGASHHESSITNRQGRIRKSREGLTLEGILAHMANTIILWRSKIGTQNDCQLGVSHLLRFYHRRMLGSRRYGELPDQARVVVDSTMHVVYVSKPEHR